MNKIIEEMLNNYDLKTTIDYEHALKEIIQQITLLGLWRGKFFEHSAFYGGTALRIFYDLDRFSEDLDFSLITPQSNFNIEGYHTHILEELESYGFSANITHKKKSKPSDIQSAFIKADTILYDIGITIPDNKKLKVKFEIDTNPPHIFDTETKLLLQPTEFFVKIVAPQDLFAGKLHAVLCRGWKNRVKGRDWYDMVWFVKQNIPVNLEHLQARMIQSGHFDSKDTLTKNLLFELLNSKIESLDIEKAKNDIAPFIKNSSRLDIWSEEFFKQVIKKLIIL